MREDDLASSGPAGSQAPRPVAGIVVRCAEEEDRAWVAEVLEERWGSTEIVSRGRRHPAERLPALVAERSGERCGLLTYRVDHDQLEVVSLDSLEPRQGVGSALLKAVTMVAGSRSCRRAWLVTTNDNLDAIRFYQRRGFRMVAVHPGAVDEARKLKPQIPATGRSGIPLHDEVEMALEVHQPTSGSDGQP